MRTIDAAAGALVRSGIHPALLSRHSEPWRAYHVWDHPLAMLGHLRRARADGVEIVDPDACVAFVAWHDSIYDPRAAHGRNEELSARLCAHEAAAVFSPLSVHRACAGVRATAGHRAVPAADCPDIALMLDVDLAILGSGREAFDRYDAAIRFEYDHVPVMEYRAGRAAVLRTFLERDRLFLTDWAHARWEEAARANLDRAIRRLETT